MGDGEEEGGGGGGEGGREREEENIKTRERITVSAGTSRSCYHTIKFTEVVFAHVILMPYLKLLHLLQAEGKRTHTHTCATIINATSNF